MTVHAYHHSPEHKPDAVTCWVREGEDVTVHIGGLADVSCYVLTDAQLEAMVAADAEGAR